MHANKVENSWKNIDNFFVSQKIKKSTATDIDRFYTVYTVCDQSFGYI